MAAAGDYRLCYQALVFYSTEDGTALAGYDYEPQSGHLFFQRGQQTKEIKILIIDDDEIEVSAHRPPACSPLPFESHAAVRSATKAMPTREVCSCVRSMCVRVCVR